MKKKIFSLSVVTIALIMSSCSSDIDEGQKPAVNNADGQAITFKVWTNKQTRAAATQAAGVTDFSLLATDTTAATAADQVLIDGAQVTGSNATSWTYTPVAYWPAAVTVNFFAFSPGLAPGITGGKAALVGQNDKTAGQPTIEYELPVNLLDQKDLLVSRRTSAYGTGTDGTIGVPLTFRHALSRVKFQAKSESTMPFKVTSIRLMNLKGKATLDLNKVPKDATAFPYPTDNATIASPGYQTHWVPDGSTIIDTLEATLTTPDVPGDGVWHDIVGDDDALYVIPQTNTASTMLRATEVIGGVAPVTGQFYIEITYESVPGGSKTPKSVTYAVPVPAIVGDAYASSIAFEMERQYTFQFELTGDKPIKLAPVKVNAYDDATPDELPLNLKWAGSNIYYDATAKHLKFDDFGDTSHEQYQGVFFHGSSLTGISPVGDYSVGTTVTYPNGGEAVLATLPYGGIPAGGVFTDTINGTGDICRYLTQKGWAPAGKRWRMPTAAEFGAVSEYTREPVAPNGFTAMTTTKTDGSDLISSGYRHKGAFFPSSGGRDGWSRLIHVGTAGIYWSTTWYFSEGTNLSLLSTQIILAGAAGGHTSMGYSFSVRCVVE